MKTLVAVILALALCTPALAQDEGTFSGFYGIDLWALDVSPYGPTPIVHDYLPLIVSRDEIRQSFDVVAIGNRTDVVRYSDFWLIVYYLGNGQVATAILMPR